MLDENGKLIENEPDTGTELLSGFLTRGQSCSRDSEELRVESLKFGGPGDRPATEGGELREGQVCINEQPPL